MWASPPEARIGDKSARKLLDLAMMTLGFRSGRYVSVPYVDEGARDFYSFQVFAQGAGDGSLGFFAVNALNGDIWNVDTCRRIDSTRVRLEQRRIVVGLKLSDGEVNDLRKMVPGCRPDAPR
jgi:hypothetical protein